VDLAINIEFAKAAGNQLSVLGTEIKDENLLLHKRAKIQLKSDYERARRLDRRRAGIKNLNKIKNEG
jgi:hypothetical protein